MNKEKIAYIRDICILALSGGVLLFLAFKYLLPAVMPFIIAWGIAMLTRRPADFIADKTGGSKKFFRPVIAVLLMLFVIGGAIFAVVRISTEAWDLIAGLSEDGTLEKFISYIISPFENFSLKFGIAPELEERLVGALSGMFSGVLSSVAGIVTGVAKAIPGIILFVLITAISVVYFAIDLENVNKRVHNILPKSWDSALVKFKDSSFSIIVKYARSYLLIMLLTFVFMLFGLLLLRVKYALLMAFIIAVLDLLPILGIGIILLPWALFMLTVGGNVKLGIGLLVLWIVGTIFRQAIEPKILGKELGIHPLLTLILMYAGYSLFGIFGLIVLPLLSVGITALGKNNTAEVEK